MQNVVTVLVVGLEVPDHLLSHLRECVRIPVGACLLYAPFPGTMLERRGYVVFERRDDPADDAACVFLDGHDAPVAVHVAVPAHREWCVVVLVFVIVVVVDVVDLNRC